MSSEAVVLTTAVWGSPPEYILGIRIGDLGGHLSALSPCHRQCSVLSQCQISQEKDQKGAHCWQPQEKVLLRGLSLFPSPPFYPSLLFPSSLPPFSCPPPFPSPQGSERGEVHEALRNTSSPPQRALWPGLGEGSSTPPEGVGEGWEAGLSSSSLKNKWKIR